MGMERNKKIRNRPQQKNKRNNNLPSRKLNKIPKGEQQCLKTSHQTTKANKAHSTQQ